MGRTICTAASTKSATNNKQKKRKWAKITAAVACVLVIYGIGFGIYGIVRSSEKSIIAEKSYINWAWGFQYQGKAIFDDGTIYKWDFEGDYGDYDAKSTKEHEDWILKYGTRIDKTVPEDKIKEMKNAIKNFNGVVFDETHIAYDGGSYCISVWKDGEKMCLKKSGDFIGGYKGQEAQDLIDMINKYLGYDWL